MQQVEAKAARIPFAFTGFALIRLPSASRLFFITSSSFLLLLASNTVLQEKNK